jgi:hypothetical protein
VAPNEGAVGAAACIRAAADEGAVRWRQNATILRALSGEPMLRASVSARAGKGGLSNSFARGAEGFESCFLCEPEQRSAAVGQVESIYNG